MRYAVGIKTGCAILFGISIGYIFSNFISQYVGLYSSIVIAVGSIGIWATARKAWMMSEETIMRYVGDDDMIPREKIIKVLEVLSR